MQKPRGKAPAQAQTAVEYRGNSSTLTLHPENICNASIDISASHLRSVFDQLVKGAELFAEWKQSDGMVPDASIAVSFGSNLSVSMALEFRSLIAIQRGHVFIGTNPKLCNLEKVTNIAAKYIRFCFSLNSVQLIGPESIQSREPNNHEFSTHYGASVTGGSSFLQAPNVCANPMPSPIPESRRSRFLKIYTHTCIKYLLIEIRINQ
uniref:Uncharacterized protein n=1 Tax=Glossina austeni TaxID=7395 RepID=A0A1A9VTI6_GLOAU